MRKVLNALPLIALLLIAGCGETNKVETSADTKKDADFIKEAGIGGMYEVKLGELATTMGTSQEVKDFGAKMVADHGKANADLAALASKKGWLVPSTLDDKHQSKVEKFSKMAPADFDKAYISEMVDDHESDVKDVKSAIPKINDTDLKTWAQGALSVMEAHLSHVKGLKK